MHAKRMLLIGLMIISVTALLAPAQAQDNLLQNPGFENPGAYSAAQQYGRPDFNFAPGWGGWYTNSPSTTEWMNINPIAFPHTAGFKRNGGASQNIGRGSGTITAAAYQTVGGIAEGTTLRASAYVYQENSQQSGARTRIGIGSNVGNNPTAPSIAWSPFTNTVNAWQQVSVETTVPAGNVTVFIYSTQTNPNDPNSVYYDDASLVVIGQGTVDDEGDDGDDDSPPPPPTATPQTFAPFVNPQLPNETGRIEHTVQSGDTLAAIAVAYGVDADEIRAKNDLDGGFLQVGQVLLIQEASEAPPTPTEADAGSGGGGTPDFDAQAAPTSTPTNTGPVFGFVTPTPVSVALANLTETAEPTDDSEPDDASEATTEATSAPAEDDEPTATADDAEPTATADDAAADSEDTTEPTPDEPAVTPTATLIPATPTDAPTAPVEQGASVDPLDIQTAICVLMFDDRNGNNILDGEPLLEGGTITVQPANGGDAQDYITDGQSEPFCFEDLETGNYTVSATAPDGFGIRRSNTLVINVQPGQQFQTRFAAAEGLEVAAAPTADVSADTDEADAPTIVEETPSQFDTLRNVAGILVVGLAGVVLVGGIGIAILASRS